MVVGRNDIGGLMVTMYIQEGKALCGCRLRVGGYLLFYLTNTLLMASIPKMALSNQINSISEWKALSLQLINKVAVVAETVAHMLLLTWNSRQALSGYCCCQGPTC